MYCKKACKLCPHLIISQALTFAAGQLEINIPAGSYANGCKYCIVIAQAIPATATITAPVVITIGDGAEEYPLTNCNCAQVVASSLRTRTKYETVVATSADGGSFRILSGLCCAPVNRLAAIDGTDPAEGGA